MSGANASLMMWAQRVVGKRMAAAHEILEVKADASLEQAQVAFHKLARVAHPDLHRNSLSPDELELLTAAYAIVAGAYQTFRTQTTQTQRIKPLREDPTPPPVSVPLTPSGPAPVANAAQSMSSKALVYYRKAELALKRGDLKSALLQIKLAIASDPNSGFLRSALAEVELELKKG